MKKIKYLMCLVVVMMFVSIMNVDAAGVSIKSIKLIDSKGSATELSDPKINGLNINFDMAFRAKNDSATYEVILNNPTNKEYEINTDKQFSKSNYISYSYELKDKTNRIKANSDITLYITIKYENQVPADKLVNGQYIENNDLGISLLNEDNPNTFNNILMLILILVILAGITIILIKTKHRKLSVIVIALLLVPVTAYALEKLTLTVSSKITIEERYNVYYLYEDMIKTSEVENNENVYDCSDKKILIENNGALDEYSTCTMVEKDSKSYKPGEYVSVKKTELTDYSEDECEYSPQYDSIICPFNELSTISNIDYLYMCGEEEYYVTIDQYLSHFQGRGSYLVGSDLTFARVRPKYLNVCTQEEFNNMGFTFARYMNWYNDFENYGEIIFAAPNSFIMPKHDIYFIVEPGK